jgi:hypothetical protein
VGRSAKIHVLARAESRVARFFLYFMYQNEGKFTKLPLNYPMALKYGHNTFQMAIEYTNFFLSMALLNLPTFFFPRPSKIYQNLDFWFENIPSGNPGRKYVNGGFDQNP